MTRPNVAVIYGGANAEHGVSCLSGGFVLSRLDGARYEAVGVGIREDGAWLLTGGQDQNLVLRGTDLPRVSAGTPVALVPGGLQRLDAPAALLPLACAVPVLHGPFGEDGTLQGVLELAGIPYVGSGVLASAAAMDKPVMKRLLAAAGLPVGPFGVLAPGSTPGQWVAALPPGPVWFVKPARAGSSYGITRVEAADELAAAVTQARRHDPKVVVETAIPGRELECAVLVGPDGEAVVTDPAEVHVVGHPFYDFDAKYLDAATQFDLPAELPPSQRHDVRALALAAFTALGCESHARVDFFLTPAGELLVNEVNTAPGLTATSLFPRMWHASGVSAEELVERLVAGAMQRGVGLR